VYGARYSQCHGRDGDQILDRPSRGLFRRSATDEDLAKVITSLVSPGAAHSVQAAAVELTGIVAFIRARFGTTASVQCGLPPADAPSLRKGMCGVPSGQRTWTAYCAPDLSDIGVARADARAVDCDPSTACIRSIGDAIVMKIARPFAGDA
jgi:hypothetical protein